MTKIEWTEKSWNPIAGCSLESPGCKRCYAMKMAARLERMGVEHYRGLTQPSKGGAVWTGKIAEAPEHTLLAPLKRRKPTTYFVNSMSDLFHEDVPDETIDRVFAVMALTPWHTYQVLTKRARRMQEYFSKVRHEGGLTDAQGIVWQRALDFAVEYRRLPDYKPQVWPLPNVWLGVSVEDQTRADERRGPLQSLARQGWTTFVSYEPALSLVDWEGWSFLAWLISGGESGPGARPSHPDWHRAARDFCEKYGIAYFFKQHGNWAEVYDRDRDDPDCRRCPTAKDQRERYVNLAGGHGFHGERVIFMRNVGKGNAGRELDGRTWDQMPNLSNQEHTNV